MAKIPRIYTRSGDGGQTSLVGGERVPKSTSRIAAVGDVDELNCALGLVHASAVHAVSRDKAAEAKTPTVPIVLRRIIHTVQQRLFDLGALLATPPGSSFQPPPLTAEDVHWLERSIDRIQDDLPPLKNFILPAGNLAAGHLHQARAIARRAERSCVALADEHTLPAYSLEYLNRLSDLLFVCARWASTGEEVLWQPRQTNPDPWAEDPRA